MSQSIVDAADHGEVATALNTSLDSSNSALVPELVPSAAAIKAIADGKKKFKQSMDDQVGF